jgi:cytoskeletal protein CcmA (bactofilin family)
MTLGTRRLTTLRREPSDLPERWVGSFEPAAELEGNMKVSGGPIRLNTHFKGAIVSDGAVVIHNQGDVQGDIQSRVVSISGKMKGTVRAQERLEIKEHGIMVGDIYTPCLLVEPGGFFDGRCHTLKAESAQPPPIEADSQERHSVDAAESHKLTAAKT